MQKKLLTFSFSLSCAITGVIFASHSPTKTLAVGSKISFRRAVGFDGAKIKLGKIESGIFLGSVKSVYKVDSFDNNQASVIQYIHDISPLIVSQFEAKKRINAKFIDSTDNVYCIKPDDTTKKGFFKNVDCVLIHKKWLKYK